MAFPAWFESRPGLHFLLALQAVAARAVADGENHPCAAPTVSAMAAPRAPSGFSPPTVLSRAV
jgi:hypothetical protein